MDPEAARYIKENRDRYTREAIEAHLLKAGYSHTEIDASWPPDDQENPQLPQGRAFWRPFILSVTGMYGITFLVYAVSFFVWDDELGIAPIASGLLLAFLLLAAMISVDIVKRKRSAWSSGTASSSRAGVAGGVLTALLIPFVFLIIVAGLCSALTGVPFTQPNF